MDAIAHISTAFGSKFGVPRQAGLVGELAGKIVFTEQYRNPDALRGIEGFSHLWLLWSFSEVKQTEWSPTVRPPRLGGNSRMGVFATRSPYRPNPIGLSCVRLSRVEWDSPDGPVLHILGADLMDGTPIFDIKPYLPYCDCHTDATGGFTDPLQDRPLSVRFPSELLEKVPEDLREGLVGVLAADPRPRYQNDPERVYGMEFGGRNVRFRVEDGTLYVTDVQEIILQGEAENAHEDQKPV